MLNAFLEWLTRSPWTVFTNNHEWAFPTIQSLHFIGFAFMIGTIAITDLRMLGFGMLKQTPAELASDLNRFTWIGFALVFISGPLQFSADAVTYHVNPSFQHKMAWLTVALLFHFTLHRKALRTAIPGVAAKLAAVTSILLWATVLSFGRFIAFV
jgi:hypothetical protein